VIPGLVTDHENHLNPDQEDKIRRRDRDLHRKEEDARKKTAREEQGRRAAERREDRQEERKFHPERKPEEWTAYDALHYFIARHREKWPKETAPGITEPKDPAAVRFRLLWLKGEKQSVSVMKEVIDYIFDKWDTGIPDRFKWGPRPGFPLIETGSIFERLLSELRHGIPGANKDPKRKIDSWNPEKAKIEPKISGRKLL
jgi:hypothetical protein